MAEEWGKKDEPKLEVDAAGQAIAHISLDQARVPALQHARENPYFHGPSYAGIDIIVSAVIDANEIEDSYEICMTFRPAMWRWGRPGIEQMFIDKTGAIEFRRIQDLPLRNRVLLLLLRACSFLRRLV